MVSIIIPTYNNLENCLKPCVDSILKYTSLNDIEVIIVANGCTDGTVEYLKGLPGCFRSIIDSKPLGYTVATNRGIKAAKGEHLVLLNNDTVLLHQKVNDWLNILLEPFSTQENVGITGPFKSHCFHSNRDFIIFFCACISREVIDKVGLLDEIFSPGFGEDIDLCIRADDAGFNVMQVPTPVLLGIDGSKYAIGLFPIYHQAEATFDNVPEYPFVILRNSRILEKRYRVFSPIASNGLYVCV